jgi:hypothetical protein
MIEINRNPSTKDLRQFAGIWFPLFCAVVGLVLYRRFGWHAAAIVVWAVGAVVAVIGLAAPAMAKPIFIGLMYVTFPIGWVVSHVLLGTVYYGMITPIGLVMRLAGRDTMTRRFDRSAATYWVPRPPVTDPERYFRQY